MTTYYIFNNEKEDFIKNNILPLLTAESDFFRFEGNLKLVKDTGIPNDGATSDTIKKYRTVFSLETNFSEINAEIRAAAEAHSEIYSTVDQEIIEYLNTPDA